MLAGHVAAGLGAKRLDPRMSTAVLLGAPLLVDLVWPVFLLLGLEQVRIDPGNTAYTPFEFTHYPVTHSLVGVLGWTAVAGIAYYLVTRNRRGAWIVAALVTSHWFFDLLMHRPDLPLYPGGAMYGLGLWNSVPATVVLELALLAAGTALFLSVTRARDRWGALSFWLLVVFTAAIALGSFMGPPPPDETSLAWFALSLWIIPIWGLWIDRHREAVT